MLTLHIPAHNNLSPAQQYSRVLEAEDAAREAQNSLWEMDTISRRNPRRDAIRALCKEEAAMWRELSLWLQSTADAGRTWQV